ncbi:MAG: hypothetical protein IJR60_00010 [Eubacterium sp.]|nr:hypothetical protein [Eubacterium sp.]
MFYQLREKLTPITLDEVSDDYITAGYVNAEELREIGMRYGFARSTIAACQEANEHFRSGVEVYDDYTFTELRIVNRQNPARTEDSVALYVMKNMLLVVDVEDYDGSTKNKFTAAINRYSYNSVTLEKVIYAFFDALIANDFKFIEDLGNEITQLEELVIKGSADSDFNLHLLQIKKELLAMHNYYEQLLDITDAIEENENDLFEGEDLWYIANLGQKIARLKEDADSLSASVTHLQDAYSASLDLKLNNTMKYFTAITSIFFPLTLIVGWYGMNFKYMPEFEWRYGYIFVILLSVAVVAVLTIIGKKKKWF